MSNRSQEARWVLLDLDDRGFTDVMVSVLKFAYRRLQNSY